MKVKSLLPYALLGVNAFIAVFGTTSLQAIDIAPMTWTPRADWINIKTDSRVSPHAVGDGVTDDTAAIQSALNIVNNNYQNPQDKTVYFPAGHYKITQTLRLGNINGYSLIGCGLNTVIQWAGPAGGAMIQPDGGQNDRYLGLVWDGGGTGGLNGTGGAGCAFFEYSDDDPNNPGGSVYITGIRHENESFRNFTATGTYYSGHSQPAGAIVGGFSNPVQTQPVGEVTIFNCCFSSCITAVYNGVEATNFNMWVIDGCEFDNNGTGFSAGGTYCYVLLNSHFQQSTVSDISGGGGGYVRGQRLTSSGSNQFFWGPTRGEAFQDCSVGSWTNTVGAMELLYTGQASVVDCSFTSPPAGASGPICTVGGTGQAIDLLLSNNSAPNFPSGSGILNELAGTIPTIDWVPAGSMGGNITSPTQTFLQSATVTDSTHIIDVTQAPYNLAPDQNLTNDCTVGLQNAINAAKTANNGSIVYIPGGFYRITSTLAVTGGNYTIEGEGNASMLCWCGGSNGTIMTVTSPQSITIRQLHLSAADNPSGTGFSPPFPVIPTTDPTTVAGIKETSTTACNVVYDNVIYDRFSANIGATYPNATGPGLVLSGLPAGSTVYMPVMASPLTVTDCGPAQIFAKMAYMGGVTVSGTTHPKTGFLGLAVAEGGQNGGWNPGAYNFTINDNQNLLVGSYYSEEEANDLQILRGAGTTTGRVAIQELNTAPYYTSATVSVNNYAGRLFFGGGFVLGGQGSAVQVNQTGTNPIDLMLAENDYTVAGSTPVIFTLGTGANLISTLNMNNTAPVSDIPNPLTAANLTSLASSLDDFRQLGALNLALEYGPANPSMINPSGLVAYWKLDEAVSPSADSSMSGITGTWVNSPTFSATKPSSIPYADAGSMSFNGSNQYINMGSPTTLPSGTHARTICGWGKLNSTTGSYSWIASFGTNTFGNAMFIGMNGTTLYAGGGQGADLTVPNFWDTNWHFIVLTYDGTTAKLYADGVLKTSAAKSWNLVPHACNIGRMTDGTQYWNGQIDDVRIYNRALSATEIANL